MTSKNKLFGNKCPYCDTVVTFASEGDYYYCPECHENVTWDFDFD